MTARLPAQLCQPAPSRDPGPMEKGAGERPLWRRHGLGWGVRRVSVVGQEGWNRRRTEVMVFRAFAFSGVMTSPLILMLKVRSCSSAKSKASTVGL